MMKMGAKNKRNLLSVALMLAFLAVVLVWKPWDSENRESFALTAFVVCQDNSLQNAKVYWVDLAAGRLIGVSDSIMNKERPTHLAFDPVYTRLYVSSEAAIGPHEWPMIVVNVDGGAFGIVSRFALGSVYEQQEIGGRVLRFSKHRINRILVSPDGNRLYVDHSGLLGTALWDAETGEELRVLSHYLDANDFVSPDGNYLYDISPYFEPEARSAESTLDSKFRAEIRGFNTQTGDLTYHRIDNQDLHAPGGHIDGPLLSFRPGRESNVLRAYDRDTGEIVSEFDFGELTSMKLMQYPRVLHNGRFLAVTMTAVKQGNNESITDGETTTQDYVVLIDAIDQRVLTQTAVGAVGAVCINTVIATEYISGS